MKPILGRVSCCVIHLPGRKDQNPDEVYWRAKRFHRPTTKSITTFQLPSIDRLFPFGDHHSQIAVTLGTGALEVLDHSVLSRRKAFVHHDPRNLQPEPFRQFFDADGEPLNLKARDLHD
jgi:hypothetical protein